MNTTRHRSMPSWRVADARIVRLGPALVAVATVGVLLLEVWQCSAVASLSDQVGRTTHALQQANAELLWARAQLDRESSRSSLGPVAGNLGLRPVDPSRIVLLPEDYLEPGDARPVGAAPSLLAYAGDALRSLVPDASARGRHVN
jgi:hypothetical protein